MRWFSDAGILGGSGGWDFVGVVRSRGYREFIGSRERVLGGVFWVGFIFFGFFLGFLFYFAGSFRLRGGFRIGVLGGV